MELYEFMKEHDGIPFDFEDRMKYYELLAKKFEAIGDHESADHYYFIMEMAKRSHDRMTDNLPDCLKPREPEME